MKGIAEIITSNDILKIFKETNALLKGHFKLSSGYHSDIYLQCALVMQYPELNSLISTLIADRFRGDKIDVVISPAIGGIILGYEVAKKLGARAIFAERSGNEKKMQFRRGFRIETNEKVLLVEDVITTGGSLREIIDLLKEFKVEIIGVASIIDRSNGEVKLHNNQYSVVTIKAEKYLPEDCPLCKNKVPIDTPGSRFI